MIVVGVIFATCVATLVICMLMTRQDTRRPTAKAEQFVFESPVETLWREMPELDPDYVEPQRKPLVRYFDDGSLRLHPGSRHQGRFFADDTPPALDVRQVNYSTAAPEPFNDWLTRVTK